MTLGNMREQGADGIAVRTINFSVYSFFQPRRERHTMARLHILLAIAGLLGLMISPSPSLAQAQQGQPQTLSPSSITPSAIVEQMLQNSKDQTQTMVALKGYVGRSGSPEVVRLYWDLTLTRYFEIPRNAIVQQMQGQDPKNDPVTLYVRSSTPIVTANSMSVDGAAAQRIESLGKTLSGGGSGLKLTDMSACTPSFVTCLAGYTAACMINIVCASGAAQ